METVPASLCRDLKTPGDEDHLVRSLDTTMLQQLTTIISRQQVAVDETKGVEVARQNLLIVVGQRAAVRELQGDPEVDLAIVEVTLLIAVVAKTGEEAGAVVDQPHLVQRTMRMQRTTKSVKRLCREILKKQRDKLRRQNVTIAPYLLPASICSPMKKRFTDSSQRQVWARSVTFA